MWVYVVKNTKKTQKKPPKNAQKQRKTVAKNGVFRHMTGGVTGNCDMPAQSHYTTSCCLLPQGTEPRAADYSCCNCDDVRKAETRPALQGKKKKRKELVTPTATNVHGDTLCSMIMGPSLLLRLAVGGWWRLVAVGGGWWLVVVAGCP